MDLEEAKTITLGTRTYRFYPVLLEEQALPVLNIQQISSILNEDDGESEEEAVNVDIGNEEAFEALAKEFTEEDKSIEPVNLFYDLNSKTYTLLNKMSTQQYFKSLFGNSQNYKTKVMKTLEKDCKCNFSWNSKDLSYEIHSTDPGGTIKAETIISTQFDERAPAEPTGYNVLNKHTGELIEIIAPGNNVTVKKEEQKEQKEQPKKEPKKENFIDEFPPFQVAFDSNSSRYCAKICAFPKAGASFLLKNRAANLKLVKSANRVEIYINNNEKYLEIKGSSENDVRKAYANFIRIWRAEEFTHFLGINLSNNPEIAQASQQMLANIGNLAPHLIVPPNQFHITLGMLSLSSTEPVINTITSLIGKIKESLAGVNPTLLINKLGFFGAPNAANVIHLELARDREYERFSQVHLLVLKGLVDSGIISPTDVKKQHFKITEDYLEFSYHLTIAKSRRAQVDLTKALSAPPPLHISIPVNSIELFTRDKPTQHSSYPIVHSFSLG